MTPDYSQMTFAQLRALCTERGLELPRSAKKSALVGALMDDDEGVEVLKATPMEPEGLAVSLLPGKLHANFVALDARIDRILADYENWHPTIDDDLKTIARERKYLSNLAGELDAKRKDIKREYLRPLNELEALINERRDRIKSVAQRLKDVENEAEELRRDAKRAELEEHFEAVAGLLADVVSYDTIAEPKWLNKTVNIETAKRALEERCRKAASDYETLKGLNLEFADEAELRFFETLDLGDATSYASKLAEDKKRLEAMKAEREAYTQAGELSNNVAVGVPVQQPVPAEQPAPVQQPVAAQPQPAPRPVPPPAPSEPSRQVVFDAVMSELESMPTEHVIKLTEALRLAKAEPAGKARPTVMRIDAATVGQLRAIGAFAGSLGVTGTMVPGTIREVYEAYLRQEDAR